MLLFFLVFLLLLQLDTVALLHLSQTQRVGHERLVSGLLLLLDGEQRILADLGSCISDRVRVLSSYEVLVRSAQLQLER